MNIPHCLLVWEQREHYLHHPSQSHQWSAQQSAALSSVMVWTLYTAHTIFKLLSHYSSRFGSKKLARASIPLSWPGPPYLSAGPGLHTSQLARASIPLSWPGPPYLSAGPGLHTSQLARASIPLSWPGPPYLSERRFLSVA